MGRAEVEGEKRRYWRGVVAEWLDSGLGMAEFSRRRGINSKQLLYWRQVLRREVLAPGVPVFQPVEVTPPAVLQGVSKAGQPLPSILPNLPGEGVCRVQLPHGVTLELTGVPQAEWLGALVAVVGRSFSSNGKAGRS